MYHGKEAPQGFSEDRFYLGTPDLKPLPFKDTRLVTLNAKRRQQVVNRLFYNAEKSQSRHPSSPVSTLRTVSPKKLSKERAEKVSLRLSEKKPKIMSNSDLSSTTGYQSMAIPPWAGSVSREEEVLKQQKAQSSLNYTAVCDPHLRPFWLRRQILLKKSTDSIASDRRYKSFASMQLPPTDTLPIIAPPRQKTEETERKRELFFTLSADLNQVCVTPRNENEEEEEGGEEEEEKEEAARSPSLPSKGSDAKRGANNAPISPCSSAGRASCTSSTTYTSSYCSSKSSIGG